MQRRIILAAGRPPPPRRRDREADLLSGSSAARAHDPDVVGLVVFVHDDDASLLAVLVQDEVERVRRLFVRHRQDEALPGERGQPRFELGPVGTEEVDVDGEAEIAADRAE